MRGNLESKIREKSKAKGPGIDKKFLETPKGNKSAVIPEGTAPALLVVVPVHTHIISKSTAYDKRNPGGRGEKEREGQWGNLWSPGGANGPRR